jgi:hypothetical protein
MERIVNLYRLRRGDQGTSGILFYNNFKCQTLELPWKDNKPNESCIPSGSYDVKIRLSPKYGQIYWVTEVPGRSFILIHSGNWAGDRGKGYKTHVNGCILLGKNRGLLQGQLAVLNSRITIKRFMLKLRLEPFTFNIYEAF